MNASLVLVGGFCLLASACGPNEPAATGGAGPCPQSTLAAIEARYALEVVTVCPDKDTRPDCVAAHPAIPAGRLNAERESGCL